MLSDTIASKLASGIDLLCCVALFPAIIFYICSFFAIGPYQVKPKSDQLTRSKGALGATAANIEEQVKTYIPTFKEIPNTIRFTFCSLLASFLAPLFNAIEKLIFQANGQMSLCIVTAKMCFILFFIGKLSTIAFLGVRSLVGYEVRNDDECLNKKTVSFVIWIYSLAFLALAIIATLDQVVMIDSGFLAAGLCFARIPSALNISLNVVDLVSSATLLVLFIIPIREVTETNKKMANPNEKLASVLRENMVVGGFTIGSAFIASITVTVFQFDPVNFRDLALLGGAIRNLDLLANCLMQLYGTRGYWLRKANWSVEQKVARVRNLSTSNSFAVLSNSATMLSTPFIKDNMKPDQSFA
jgi:hypothetical protein